MGQLIKTISVQVPAKIVYESLKTVETDINTIMSDLFGLSLRPEGIFEEIPYSRISFGSKRKTVTVELSDKGSFTDCTIRAERGGMSGKVVLGNRLYILKAIEKGYLSAKRPE